MKTTIMTVIYAVAFQFKFDLHAERFGSSVALFSNQFPKYCPICCSGGISV
ncbi:MAG: hypothetical protein COC00_007225 [Rhizobiales bacterium]|nr:hypothetical protein [Hyphomicrobiales bacterium]